MISSKGVRKPKVRRGDYEDIRGYIDAQYSAWAKVGRAVYEQNKAEIDATLAASEARDIMAGYRVGTGSYQSKFADAYATRAISSEAKTVQQANYAINRSTVFEKEAVRFKRNLLVGFKHDAPDLYGTLQRQTGLAGAIKGPKGQFLGRMSIEAAAHSEDLTYEGEGLYTWKDAEGTIWEIRAPKYIKEEDPLTKKKVKILIKGYGFREKGETDWIESAEPAKGKHYKTRADFPTAEDWAKRKAKKRKK